MGISADRQRPSWGTERGFEFICLELKNFCQGWGFLLSTDLLDLTLLEFLHPCSFKRLNQLKTLETK